MDTRTVGILHPGAMGAAIGRVLVGRGHRVLWASEGRGQDTRRRARDAGLRDAGSVAGLLKESEIVLSICPPHAAAEVAALAAGYGGIYVDANAIAPATVRRIAAGLAPTVLVDGGIVGGPPDAARGPRMYLSGEHAQAVRGLFDGTPVQARVVDGTVGRASALKMAYAAWTKGSAALVLAARELAVREGVDEMLVSEWSQFSPEVLERWQQGFKAARTKGWRWVAEMEEIAAAMADEGLPDGFHKAAAEIYRQGPWEGLAAGRPGE